MKGIVFTSLNDMIIEQFGIETWDQLVSSLDLPSGGSYTAGGTYSDTEFQQLIQAIAKRTNQHASVFLEAFGEYMFPILSSKYAIFLKKDMTLKEFLKSIDGTIHVEVEKLYPDETLPTISYEEPTANQLVMVYRSHRRLCHFAMGLIQGAAQHFKKKITIKQTHCMLKKMIIVVWRLPLSDENKALFERSYYRERKAREEAELLLENKTRELHLLNQDLEKKNSELLKTLKDLESVQKKLSKLAHFDVLSRLPNRLQFELDLKREIARSKRYGRHLALLSIDLDFLKM